MEAMGVLQVTVEGEPGPGHDPLLQLTVADPDREDGPGFGALA
jgi:hypothetical protein